MPRASSSSSSSPSPSPPSLSLLLNLVLVVVVGAATSSVAPNPPHSSLAAPPAVAFFAASPLVVGGAAWGWTGWCGGAGGRQPPPLPLPSRASRTTGETRLRWHPHPHPPSARRREPPAGDLFRLVLIADAAAELRRSIVVAAGGGGGIDGDGAGASAAPSLPSSPRPLPSLFPTDDRGNPLIPAGLRGEAVRSAYSQRSICLNLSDMMNCGVVRVRGKGTRDFLANKLTNSFPPIGDGGSDIIGGVSATTDAGGARGACLLTPRGRVVDRLLVPYFYGPGGGGAKDDEAYLITSPDVHSYHGSNHLFQRLDPLVFPMDRVKLTDLTTGDDDCAVFAVASSDVRRCADLIEDRIVRPFLRKKSASSGGSVFALPQQKGRCTRLVDEGGRDELIVVHGVDHALPSNFRGYTVLLRGNGGLGKRAWEELCRDDDVVGGAEESPLPLAVGPLEWETLRVEHGLPGVGTEMTAGRGDDGGGGEGDEGEDATTPQVAGAAAPAGPMELNLGHSTVDVDKGCYLGQEGVAAVLNNKRGLPRRLYSVVFDDSDNGDDDDDDDGNDGGDDDGGVASTIILPGDELFLLGSNEAVSVGKITSVSPEPGGTGRAETVAVALVRRADGILGRASQLGLDVGVRPIGGRYGDGDEEGRGGNHAPDSDDDDDDPAAVAVDESDPLHGLEVLVGGTDVVGTLRAVATSSSSASPRTGPSSEEVRVVEEEGPSSVMGYYIPPTDESETTAAVTATASTPPEDGIEDEDEVTRTPATVVTDGVEEGADGAEAEAKRKKLKLDMLRKKAEEAMEARRRKKREERERKNASAAAAPAKDGAAVAKADVYADAEARRKAAKMEMLRKRADAAMEARRRKKDTAGEGG